MTSHRQIIELAGGATALSRAIRVPVGRVHAWKRNNSIPGRYWASIAKAGFASTEELSVIAPKPVAELTHIDPASAA